MDVLLILIIIIAGFFWQNFDKNRKFFRFEKHPGNSDFQKEEVVDDVIDAEVHETPKKEPKQHRTKKKMNLKKGKRIAGVLVVLAVVFICAVDSFYMLNENTYAVVTTFGKPSVEESAGLHFKIPWIQRVHKITKNIMGMPIGYDPVGNETDPASEGEPIQLGESEMITKDFNFVNVDFYIEYQVTDPIQAYTHEKVYQELIKNLAQSYIRDTVGSYLVDDVITTGKSEIQALVKEKLSQRLIDENIGYGIYNVTIQDAQPPTAEVTDAFKAVEDAKQGMDTAINEAKKYQSEQIPTANAKADKLIQDAEAYKQERINEASGQAARFNDLYAEYSKYPLITKKRMFYEAMEEVLPDLKVVINSADGTQTLLPLAPFSEPASEQEKGETE